VRFNEVDSMRIFRHVHYMKYMEDGREDFGWDWRLSYLGNWAQGYMVPGVKLLLTLKEPLRYGDKALVEIRFTDSDAAKWISSF